jgi:hypothetical protein
MPKPIKSILIALLMVTGSAWAEWVEVLNTAESDFYIDPASIRRDGSLRRAWAIQNLKQPGTGGKLSNRIRCEYDCKKERYRFLLLREHSGPMSGGTTLLQTSLPRAERDSAVKKAT